MMIHKSILNQTIQQRNFQETPITREEFFAYNSINNRNKLQVYKVIDRPATRRGSFFFPSERNPWRVLALEYIEMLSPFDIILAIATDAK